MSSDHPAVRRLKGQPDRWRHTLARAVDMEDGRATRELDRVIAAAEQMGAPRGAEAAAVQFGQHLARSIAHVAAAAECVGANLAEIQRKATARPGGTTEVAALIAPVIASRHPNMTMQEVDTAAQRFARIGADPASLRYQIERGLIRD